MGNIKFLRILFVLIFLSLLLVAVPAPSAWAARGITLSPTQGSIGTRITVTGTEFNKSTSSSDKYAAIYFSSDEASTIDDIGAEVTHYKLVREGVWLDENGDFETTFKVPEVLDDGSKEKDVVSGTYYVYVCHYVGTTVQPRIRALATFTVTLGEIAISPLRGTVDTPVEITGTDFPEDEEIVITYDGSSVPIYSGSRRTNSNGGFTSIIRIPESTAGSHAVTAGVSGVEVEETFVIEPEILINPASGETGDAVVVSGTGFGKMKAVIIWFYNSSVATSRTDMLGSFYVDFNVPDLQAGLYNVDAEEGANIGKAKFNIVVPQPPSPPSPSSPEPVASASISATTGNIGQGVIVSGTGFKANAAVTIEYDGKLITAVTTDGDGIFSAAFTVPVSKNGNHAVIASDGTNTSDFNFTVESIPPPAPPLLLPQMGDKITSPIRFKWQAVTDASLPVIYTLQIATSSDFLATSVVLEKKELTETEYTLTDAERLGLGTGKKPYYWRVMAIDGASNEGNWASPRVFYVVSSGMPTWLIITIVIVGAVLLLALGYFIHLRTSTLK